MSTTYRPSSQQVTRLPNLGEVYLRPGDWVVLRDGRTRQVKSLTCAVTERDQKAARWHVHFQPAGSCPAGEVARLATTAEIQAAERRAGR